MAVTPINDQERWNSIYLFDLIFLKGMAKFLKEKTFNFLNTYKNKYVIKIFIIIIDKNMVIFLKIYLKGAFFFHPAKMKL